MFKKICKVLLTLILIVSSGTITYCEDDHSIMPIGQCVTVDKSFGVPENPSIKITIYGSYEINTNNNATNISISAKSSHSSVRIDGVYSFSNGRGIIVDVYYTVDNGSTIHSYTVNA